MSSNLESRIRELERIVPVKLTLRLKDGSTVVWSDAYAFLLAVMDRDPEAVKAALNCVGSSEVDSHLVEMAIAVAGPGVDCGTGEPTPPPKQTEGARE